MIELGDIVRGTRALRFVVVEFVQGPNASTFARLHRRDSEFTVSSFTQDVRGLTLVERPTYQPDEKVTVNGQAGRFVAIRDDGWAEVFMAQRVRKGIVLPAAPARVPIWLLNFRFIFTRIRSACLRKSPCTARSRSQTQSSMALPTR